MKTSCCVILCALLTYANAQQEGDIRLADGSVNRGRLEVYLDGSWGTVCFDYILGQLGVAQAACRQLGYSDALEVASVEIMQLPVGTGDIKLRDMFCYHSSNMQDAVQHLLRCEYDTGDTNCHHVDDMAIECTIAARDSFPYDTMVELVDDEVSPGNSVSSGVAEVFINKEWGPVCNMKKNDADSFCRQLGYTGASSVEDMNMTSDRPEVLDKFSCTESEYCLRPCFAYPEQGERAECDSKYSHVICEFQKSKEDDAYGTEFLCTIRYSSNSGAVAGAVIGTLLILTACIVIALGVCFCVPGCIFYGEKRKKLTRLYQTKVTYDSL